MAVKKIKWKTLINQIQASSILFNADLESAIDDIDDLIDEQIGENADIGSLGDLLGYIKSDIITDSNNGIWADLMVYTSSYIENDKRLLYLLLNKLREYVGFYKKILTDNGVQRALVYSKTYQNNGSSNNIDRNINSDVPQNSNLYDSEHPTSNALFDQAIADFASSIAKNKADATSHTDGTSGTNVTGTTWEEGKANIQMMFYNELKDYIYSLPERIYSIYSLDSVPAPELVKKVYEYYHNLRDLVNE